MPNVASAALCAAYKKNNKNEKKKNIKLPTRCAWQIIQQEEAQQTKPDKKPTVG